MASSPNGRDPGSGGAGSNGAGPEPSNRVRIPMYVHREGYSFANILYSVQGYALPRPQRLLPLVVSLLVGIFVSVRIIAPLAGGLAGLATFGAIVWYGPRLVEELESACGRNPIVEIGYWIRHLLNYRRKYFIGTRRADSSERWRLAHHFAHQRELAGVASHRGRGGRTTKALGGLGRTLGLALLRSARPKRKRQTASGDFDTRTDTRSEPALHTEGVTEGPNKDFAQFHTERGV